MIYTDKPQRFKVGDRVGFISSGILKQGYVTKVSKDNWGYTVSIDGHNKRYYVFYKDLFHLDYWWQE